MNSQHTSIALILALSVAGLSGCATSKASNVYSRAEARQIQEVYFGQVLSVRPVLIEGTESGVGTLAGAGIGGIAGSTVGGGRGSAIAAIAGAVLGGVLGSAIEGDATHQAGLEITVKLESGKIIAVVQETAGSETFHSGQRVRVLSNGWETRVTH